MHHTLYLLSNDLRTHDNAALQRASAGSQSLLCLYINHYWIGNPGRFGFKGAATARSKFQHESLTDLNASLNKFGQKLWMADSVSTRQLQELVTVLGITRVISSQTAGYYENQFLAQAQLLLPDCEFECIATHTLFSAEQLPFHISALPATFTQFRKAIEAQSTHDEVQAHDELSYLAPPPKENLSDDIILATDKNKLTSRSLFSGGETAALSHIETYFSTGLPSNYKKVRNSIDGFDNSTKVSPWLANGALSVRRLMFELKRYEAENGANESTYWIYFELLWREFFQWNAHKLGKHLFTLGGSEGKSTLTSYYPERFQKWANGNTPYPLVNAIMLELSASGYISNRARQIAASCMVNELSLDWRYGAAWFERHLIDYDVASNWGNWQYLAGVGADAQPKRHFNIAKQSHQFDPNGEYVSKWVKTPTEQVLDSVDAADWPIT